MFLIYKYYTIDEEYFLNGGMQAKVKHQNFRNRVSINDGRLTRAS
jgi:hypothetical protein